MNKNTSNISSDSSSSCIDWGEFQAGAISEITKWIALIEALGIIILNIILIILLAKRKKPSRMAFFVKHLAVADLCVGLLYVLPECIFDRFLNNWEKLPCLILYGYCANMTIYASTFLIVVLTIDRLFVIIRPLSASTTGSKYRYGLISVAWILAISLAIPYALHIKFICTSQGNLCGHSFPNQEAIVVAELFINVIIPVFIIALCYTWIIVIIWRRESATLGCTAQKIRYSNASTTLTGNFQKTVSSTSSVITNAKKKTIKVLLVIVIVYILSWTPINVAQVMNVFNILATDDLYTFLHVLAPINSLMNPVVFLCFNREMFKPEKSKTMCFTTASQVYSDRIT